MIMIALKYFWKGFSMSGIFLKFKRRLNSIRLSRASMIGIAVGLLSSGVWLILYKLAVINFEPITSLFVGLGAALLCGGLVFVFTGKSDKVFAEELDRMFNLKARVQTMVAYSKEEGDMISIQRQDAERALSKIPVKSYKFKRAWIYIIAMVLAVIPFVVGIALDDVREYTPPEEIIPFELSALQETGINEMIKYVETSEMEEEFKTSIVDELRGLLAKLRVIKTQPQMIAAVSNSMSVIRDITYESSTATEILNALWYTDDVYLRYFAKALDTSDWNAPEWGDFAEKITDYAGVLMGDNKADAESGVVIDSKENLKFALDIMTRKLDGALDDSGVGEDDEIRLAIKRLFYNNPGGFAPLLASIDYIDADTARKNLNLCFEFNSENLYNAISLNKTNANVGEYVMIRLGSLFGVPSPEFERPEFVKTGESIGDKGPDDDKNDKDNSNSTGGLGTGATFGSNDIVIDPFTGEPIEYGKLFSKYYGIMFEKLEGDTYTEEQKEAIRKYFDLLYGSTQKEEGK